MDRLTYWQPPKENAYLKRGLDNIWGKRLKGRGYEIIINAINRLAAYEDTGLEPDEIPQLQEKYDTAIKALSGAILEKSKASQWVLLNEELPKISGEYLVLTEDGDMLNANFDKDCGDNGEFGEWQDRYDEHTLGFLDSEWSSYGGITYWMPLPQTPKGEKP